MNATWLLAPVAGYACGSGRHGSIFDAQIPIGGVMARIGPHGRLIRCRACAEAQGYAVDEAALRKAVDRHDARAMARAVQPSVLPREALSPHRLQAALMTPPAAYPPRRRRRARKHKSAAAAAPPMPFDHKRAAAGADD